MYNYLSLLFKIYKGWVQGCKTFQNEKEFGSVWVRSLILVDRFGSVRFGFKVSFREKVRFGSGSNRQFGKEVRFDSGSQSESVVGSVRFLGSNRFRFTVLSGTVRFSYLFSFTGYEALLTHQKHLVRCFLCLFSHLARQSGIPKFATHFVPKKPRCSKSLKLKTCQILLVECSLLLLSLLQPLQFTFLVPFKFSKRRRTSATLAVRFSFLPFPPLKFVSAV